MIYGIGMDYKTIIYFIFMWCTKLFKIYRDLSIVYDIDMKNVLLVLVVSRIVTFSMFHFIKYTFMVHQIVSDYAEQMRSTSLLIEW